MGSEARRVSDDDFLCVSHPSDVVVLYCVTCEDLICPRCVSQGASCNQTHRDHIYLDLMEAYTSKKEQFQRVINNFLEVSQTKKNERKVVQTEGQKLKLELLRKKTEVARKTRTLCDTINRHKRQHLQHLEKVIKPAVVRNEVVFRDLDFEVVSREGLLNMAESTQNIPEEKPIQFLRVQARLEKCIVELSSKSPVYEDQSYPELQQLKMTTLAIRNEKHHVTKAYLCSQTVPGCPRIIPSWCTIGQTSASLVFKSPAEPMSSHYHVTCDPYSRNMADPSPPRTVIGNCSTPDNKKTSSCAKRQVFCIAKRSGRRQICVLRSLRPGVTYRVAVFSANHRGHSQPAVLYITTAHDSKSSSLSFKEPRKSLCSFVCKGLLQTLLLLLLMLLFAWAVFGMYSTGHIIKDQTQTMFSYVSTQAAGKFSTQEEGKVSTQAEGKVSTQAEGKVSEKSVLERLTDFFHVSQASVFISHLVDKDEESIDDLEPDNDLELEDATRDNSLSAMFFTVLDGIVHTLSRNDTRILW